MKRALKERFRRIVSPPFPRLEMLAFVYPVGEGGRRGGGLFCRNASSSVGLTECFCRSNTGRVLLDSKGEGRGWGKEWESGRACNNSFVNWWLTDE